MTIIAKGAEVKGALNIEGNIRVDGTVNGDIKATDSIEVGQTGRIVGKSIVSKTAVIHGHVEGDLVASQNIVLGSKSTLVGNLKAKSLVIEECAVFHGNSAVSENDSVSGISKLAVTETVATRNRTEI